ncbi:class I SAM-dependent methyltransferase, partial [Halobacteriovorax sp. HFRX-1_3]|uniref:class I SAM-dependent methyltransferase n=2 Tax=unclassified Halobacteriovorax TaxID=2639665 RepID=UPI00371AF394
DVLEVGSWCGRSAVVLGLAATKIGDTKVDCVDLFPSKSDWYENEDGSYSFRVDLNGDIKDGYHVQTVWKEPFERDIAPIYEKYESVLDAFNEAIENAGVSGIVSPFKSDSTIIGATLKSKYKLVFLDGDHSYDAVVQDIERAEPLLVSGGWICFDDAHSYYEGVDRAIHDKIVSSGKYDIYQQLTRKLFVARKK